VAGAALQDLYRDALAGQAERRRHRDGVSRVAAD
jgi:hypothetical protein